jgi:hypothetical protein
MTLTEAERLEGAEAIASFGRKLRLAIVVGVQAPATATAIRYAQSIRLSSLQVPGVPSAANSSQTTWQGGTPRMICSIAGSGLL